MRRRTTEQRGRRCGTLAILPLWVTIFTVMAAGGRAQEPRAAHPDQLAVLDEAPVIQYRAYRRMHAVNEKFDKEAWLEAWTELDARGFRYEIVSQRGSEYVLEKVLRKILAREKELIDQGQAERADLSADNYEFAEPAAHGRGVRYILLKPKRKDMLLVDGRMVLSQDGNELLRVEGRLAKNPSFWTGMVNVIREFARLDGVRVPVTTESIAKLKLAGTSRMMVRYEYETINGRPVSLSARRMMVSASSSR